MAEVREAGLHDGGVGCVDFHNFEVPVEQTCAEFRKLQYLSKKLTTKFHRNDFGKMKKMAPSSLS